MKITYMRTENKEVPSTDTILEVEKNLRYLLDKAGFITEVNAITRTSMKIGQHMRSFSLDLTKHDRNLYVSRCGDKLTNLPTWDQRVEFNNIVNSVLDMYKLSANIKSGPYTIRKGFQAMNEDDWYKQKPDWVRHNEIFNYIESIDEVEYLEQRRIERNTKRRELSKNKTTTQTKTKFQLKLVK